MSTHTHLIPVTALYSDEHARGLRRYYLDLHQKRADRARLAHDLVARPDRLFEAEVLLLQLQVRERVADRDENPVRVERLLHDVVRAELGRFDGRLDRGVTADHYDRNRVVLLAHPLERLEAVHAGHLHVEENEMRLPLRERGQPVGRVGFRADLVTVVL